jgi:hypothetical protein
VLDAQGAVVPRVKILATLVQTGAKFETLAASIRCRS